MPPTTTSTSHQGCAAARCPSPSATNSTDAAPIQEFVHSRDAALVVDRAAAIIRGVKILGLDSQNGRSYLPGALSAAVPLYEGAKVNVNHAKGHPTAPRDYQDRIGRLRGVHARAGAGLFGDLHLNPRHALAEQLLWDAAHAPENVGFSHNVQARTAQREGRTVVESIVAVHSVDLVADPATTRGLFETRLNDSSQCGGATVVGRGLLGETMVDGADACGGTAVSAALRRPLADCTLAELRAARPDLALLLLTEEHDARLAVQAQLADSATQLAESAARLAEVEARLAEHTARESLTERRRQVVSLLQEFGLPDPASNDPAASRLVDAAFMESLLAAPDERAQRALVTERARLVAEVRRFVGDAAPATQPRSREQQSIAGAMHSPRGGREFVRAVT